MPISDFQSQFSISKIIQIFTIFCSLNNQFRGMFFIMPIFQLLNLEVAEKILNGMYVIHIVNAYCSLQGHAGLTKVGCLAICHFHLVMYILRHYFSFFMSSIFLAAYLHSAQLLRGRNNYYAISQSFSVRGFSAAPARTSHTF